MEQLTTVRFSNSSAERRFLFGTFLPMCMSTLGTIAAARSISATVGHHTVGVGDLEILLGCKVKAVQCREIGTCRTDRFSSGNRHERVFGKVMHGYLNLNTDKGDGLSPERYQERVGREGIVQDSTKLKDLDVLIARVLDRGRDSQTINRIDGGSSCGKRGNKVRGTFQGSGSPKGGECYDKSCYGLDSEHDACWKTNDSNETTGRGL